MLNVVEFSFLGMKYFWNRQATDHYFGSLMKLSADERSLSETVTEIQRLLNIRSVCTDGKLRPLFHRPQSYKHTKGNQRE